MVIRKRPELDTVNPPGQIRNDITLGDYVARKQEYMREEAKKLSFDEWYKQNIDIHKNYTVFNGDSYILNIPKMLFDCWNAAQRNK